MWIDQLKFQSVQLGYLKILQMGDADPNNKKAEKEYEVKPQPVSHHSSVVFRHSQSVGHPPMIALYLSGTTHLSVGHNVALSQVLNRSMAQYVCTNAMKFKSDFNMHKLHLTRHRNFSLLKIATSLVTYNTVGTSLELKSVKEISYLSSQLHFSSLIPTVRTHIWFYLAKQLLTARTKLKTARNTYPEAHTHRRTLYSTVAKTHQRTASSRSLSNVEPGFITGINRKSYSRRAQRHQSRLKQRCKSTEIYRRRVRMNSNYRGFTGENDEEYRVQNTLSVEQHLVSKRVTNSTANDIAPTNQNDVA
ncbi:hypothetical protein F511_34265 [Dorcoceras hygrometricum]|uniref:Uncharacterized protein n=1 Tax=Dorcoceras hygrometricum TaxID=472368 RepID=A0A2Z7B0X3_9LAMI|nr:hypothetical protein F511_34265 [Dorcoceras hygrometricum]